MSEDRPDFDPRAPENLERFGAVYHGRYGTFWGRLAAGILDAIATSLVIFAVGFMLGIESKAAIYFSGFFPFAYSIVLHGRYGRTMGKKLMGLKVIDKSERKEIGYKQAFIRDAVPILITLLVIFGSGSGSGNDLVGAVNFVWFLLEVLTVLFNQKRRAVHDFMAGTVVVKA